MTLKVYTIGYSGRKPGQILDLAEELDAIVFDIRFSPRSRIPHWNGSSLSQLLGKRYCHVKAFGNRNYRGGSIAIVSYNVGKSKIAASEKAVILMCVCKDAQRCHRTLIAEWLKRDGFEVEELGQQAKQLRLIGGTIR